MWNRANNIFKTISLRQEHFENHHKTNQINSFDPSPLWEPIIWECWFPAKKLFNVVSLNQGLTVTILICSLQILLWKSICILIPQFWVKTEWMFRVQHSLSSINSICGARHFTEINIVDTAWNPHVTMFKFCEILSKQFTHRNIACASWAYRVKPKVYYFFLCVVCIAFKSIVHWHVCVHIRTSAWTISLHDL